MNRKMYKKPITEITVLAAESIMQGIITLSPGTNGPGATDAPRRRGDIID